MRASPHFAHLTCGSYIVARGSDVDFVTFAIHAERERKSKWTLLSKKDNGALCP